jgi:hypothetical protein
MKDFPESSPLRKAEKFIQARNFQDALDILVPYVRVNPRSENGWYLLSFAVDGIDRKIECVERILSINPENNRAQARLLKLRGVNPPDSDDETTHEEIQKTVKETKKKHSFSWAIFFISILLIGLITFIIIKEIIPSFSVYQFITTAEIR